MTLDDIEHAILRKQFNEPRIHMAINCASISCPPLLNEPFEADRAFLGAGRKLNVRYLDYDWRLNTP